MMEMVLVANVVGTVAEMERTRSPADVANSLQAKGKVCAGRHTVRPAYEPFGSCDMTGKHRHNLIAGCRQRRPLIDSLTIRSEPTADFRLVKRGARTARTKRDQSIQKARVSRLA